MAAHAPRPTPHGPRPTAHGPRPTPHASAQRGANTSTAPPSLTATTSLTLVATTSLRYLVFRDALYLALQPVFTLMWTMDDLVVRVQLSVQLDQTTTQAAAQSPMPPAANASALADA